MMKRIHSSTSAAASMLLVGALTLGNDAFACRDHDVPQAHKQGQSQQGQGQQGQGHDHGAAKHASTTTKHDTTKHDTTKHATSSHAAINQKGNGSGVSVGSKTDRSIAVGVASPLRLDFGAARTAGAVAQLRAPDGVTITLADGTPVTEVALTVGRPTSVDLLVTASNDGMQYLDVTTLQNQRASVQSVALPVGSAQSRMKQQGRVEVTASGERVKVMKAQ